MLTDKINLVVELSSSKQEQVSDDTPKIWAEFFRRGNYYSQRSGRFTIDSKTQESCLKNFKDNAFGQTIYLNYEHSQDKSLGSPAEICDLRNNGDVTEVLLGFTPEGVKAVKDKGITGLSVEMDLDYTDNQEQSDGSRKSWGPTITGGALTLKPFIKHQQPINPLMLSEDEHQKIYLSESLNQQIKKDNTMDNEAIAELLDTKLRTIQLSDERRNTVMALFNNTAKDLSKEGAQTLSDLCFYKENLEAKKLNLSDEANTVSVAEQIKQALDVRDEQEQAKQAHKLKLTDVYNKTINDSTLPSPIKDRLLQKSNAIITVSTDEAQVIHTAKLMLSEAEQTQIALELSGNKKVIGPKGIINSNTLAHSVGQEVQKIMDDNLKGTNAFSKGKLQLSDEANQPNIVKEIMASYDAANLNALKKEKLYLSDTENEMSNMTTPASLQRTVLRESFADTKILELVRVIVESNMQSTIDYFFMIEPGYSSDNYGIVYEGSEIDSVATSTDKGRMWIVPRKIGQKASNEILHFSRTSEIDWNAWADDAAASVRIMKDYLAKWLSDTMVRICDGYQCNTMTDENIASQLDGNKTLIKTAQFPIVNPFQQYDLSGTKQGGVENPITLTIEGKEILPFLRGTAQPAGSYYVIENHNLGYLRLVNENGEIIAGNASTATLSYSYPNESSVIKLDSDFDDTKTTKSEHLNSLVEAVGDCVVYFEEERYFTPEFSLMSLSLNNEIGKASRFRASDQSAGASVSGRGDLTAVKDLPAYKTNNKTHIGKERILIGKTEAVTWMVVKPLTPSGEIIECTGPNGKPTGKKQTYMEEFSGVDCPGPLRNSYASVIWYSASKRASAA